MKTRKKNLLIKLLIVFQYMPNKIKSPKITRIAGTVLRTVKHTKRKINYKWIMRGIPRALKVVSPRKNRLANGALIKERSATQDNGKTVNYLTAKFKRGKKTEIIVEWRAIKGRLSTLIQKKGPLKDGSFNITKIDFNRRLTRNMVSQWNTKNPEKVTAHNIFEDIY